MQNFVQIDFVRVRPGQALLLRRLRLSTPGESSYERQRHLLGGYAAACEVERLAAALATGASPDRGTCRRLQNLLDLLMLENVHDPERVEMGHFAAIDPADPCVAEICLLAEGLADAMASWRQAQRTAARDRSVRGVARQAA